jgi:hypothetical protein
MSIEELKEAANRVVRESNLMECGVKHWTMEEGDKDFFEELGF